MIVFIQFAIHSAGAGASAGAAAVVLFIHDTVEIEIWLNKPKIESNRIESRISRYHTTWLKSTRAFQLFLDWWETYEFVNDERTCVWVVSYEDAEANIMGLLEYVC